MGGAVIGLEKLLTPTGNLAVTATIILAVAAGAVVYAVGVNLLRVAGIDELLERTLPWRYVPKHRNRVE
jgi:hypothetical protein